MNNDFIQVTLNVPAPVATVLKESIMPGKDSSCRT